VVSVLMVVVWLWRWQWWLFGWWQSAAQMREEEGDEYLGLG
jgi:hypothetical protein